MVTLSKRATVSQRRILRAVEGAVKNTADAHPEYNLTPYVARSIAKRAAGTLTAGWPDTLAASSVPSDRAGDETAPSRQPQPRLVRKRAERGPPKSLGRRSPLRLLWKELSIKVDEAKRTGRLERADAFIEILGIR